MYKKIIIWAGVFAVLSVIFGAFGAHGLKELVSIDALATFEVGVRYQMYHALALLFIGFSPQLTGRIQKTVLILFTIGIFLFSGSIYLLSLNAILPFDATVIGFVTPLGGICFIIGWVYFLVGIIKLKSI